ncbi:MAG: HAD family hydrolase [Planctomycetota bacterium]|jgi:phosphoglycolate phosphatase-like HAD superfamily hydrolase
MQPDLVIFDVDGTIHDTFAWWHPVITKGLEEFGRREGLALDRPEEDFANQVVGMSDAGVWAPFLPEAEKHRWQELRALVLPMEVAEISSGKDYLFPGVRDLLLHLRGIHVRTALASNCRSEYMAGICQGQGLGSLTDQQFCLDSPGVGSKSDMLRLAVEALGAQRPVMVGDRENDQQAAAEAGMPFYWRVNCRCSLSGVSGRWHGDPGDLLNLLGLPGISTGPGEAGSRPTS